MDETQYKLYSCLLQNGFAAADAQSHPIIKDYRIDSLLYDMTPCVIVIWSDEYHALYKFINGFLCFIQFYPDGEWGFLIASPASEQSPSKLYCGDNLQRIVDTLYDLSLKAGLDTLYLREIEERFLFHQLFLRSNKPECSLH